MKKESSLNVIMLLFSIGAAFAVYLLGELLLAYVATINIAWQCAIYLTFVTALCFVAIFIAEKISPGYYIPRGRITFSGTCAKAAAILIPCAFILGLLTQLLYGITGISAGNLNPNFKGTMLVCDISGSMRSNDPEYAAVDALAKYIESVPLGEYLGVTVFNDDDFTLREYVVLASEKERSALIEQINDSIEYGGGTNIQGALMGAIRQVRNIEEQNWPGLVILFSDGLSDVDYTKLQSAALGNTENLRNAVPVSTVYFGDALGGYQMSNIAQKTGGNYLHLSLDVDSSELREVFTRSRASFSFERPHLLQMYAGPARTSMLRIIMQALLLSLWGIFTGLATVVFLNNSRLFTAFLIPRAIVSVLISTIFVVILAGANINAVLPLRALLAGGFCLLYLPTFSWDTDVY
jgi:hypothetical protein